MSAPGPSAPVRSDTPYGAAAVSEGLVSDGLWGTSRMVTADTRLMTIAVSRGDPADFSVTSDAMTKKRTSLGVVENSMVAGARYVYFRRRRALKRAA